MGLTYSRLANLAELAQARRLRALTRWLMPAYLIAAVVMLTCVSISVNPLALLVFAPIVIAEFILWALYLQLLTQALRRSST